MKILLSTQTLLAVAFLLLVANHNIAIVAAGQAPQEKESPTEQPVVSGQAQTASTGLVARGVVFSDLDNDGEFGENDAPFRNVKVSNGKDIVLTDENGKYEIPVEEDSAVFVIKPSGYRTAMNENNLPQFFYLHKPDGSPKLKFPGSKPTGALPQSARRYRFRQS